MAKFSKKKRWVSTDAWRGYDEPVFEIAGASDTGMWEDSPAPSDRVDIELVRVKKYLKEERIPYREVKGGSSNAFMGKRWIITDTENYPQKKKKVREWIDEQDFSYVHD